jgi:phage-related protein
VAEERTITTVFKADISNFSASTQELNRYVAQVNSEFKNATASMGRWNDNAEGLRAKLEQLGKVHEAEKRKLSDLEAQYAEVVRTQGANSKAAQKLATDINNQSAKVKETEKNIEFYTESLEELEKAGVETREELDKFNKELEEQKEAAKELGGSIAKGAVAGIAGIGTACVGAMKAVSGIVEETKELRTQMGMLETTFTQQGQSVEAAEKTFDDLFSVLGDNGKATEAALQLAQVAKSEKELEDYTKILTGVYATFGDSLPVEALAEAINHSSELGSVQGNLADALEWSGINVDDFNAELEKLNTEEERSKLIQDTLNGIYGETADSYKEVNKEVIAANKAQNDYNKAMADIGKAVEPAMTSFKGAMVGVLQTVLTKLQEVDIEGLIANISGAITTLTEKALPPLVTAIEWVLNNMNWLVPVLGTVVGVIGSIAAGVKIYNTVMEVAKVVQLAWNAAMAANPIGIVVVAIGALVAAFVYLWNNCEAFRNFWIGLWDVIKNAVSVAVDWIKVAWQKVLDFFMGDSPIAIYFQTAWENIKIIWDTVVAYFQMIWDNIKLVFSAVKSVLSGDFSGAWEAIKQIFANAGEFVAKAWENMKKGASNTWQGIKEIFSKVAEFFGGIFSKAWQKVKDVFSVGGKIFDGIKDGIVSAFTAIVNAIIKGINKVISIPFNAINSVLDNLRDIDILGVQPFGWVNTFSVPQIPLLAKGGIVDKATLAVVGEAGKEAVMPLENNTGWIDMLADKLAERSGSRTTNNTINNYFERMETSRHALHRANLETRRILEGV